jgi:hypothetical protein
MEACSLLVISAGKMPLDETGRMPVLRLGIAAALQPMINSPVFRP